MSTPPEPSHLGICVSDLDRSLRFYCDGLGFSASDPFELDSTAVGGLDRALEVPGPVRVTSQFIELGPMKIELIGWHEPSPTGAPSQRRDQVGLTHLSFYVDNVDETAQHLVACGGTLLPDTRSNPGLELVFLADPDGVRVELMERPKA